MKSFAPYVVPKCHGHCPRFGPYYRRLISIHNAQTLGLPVRMSARPKTEFSIQTHLNGQADHWRVVPLGMEIELKHHDQWDLQEAAPTLARHSSLFIEEHSRKT